MTAFGVFWGLLMLILLMGLGQGVYNGIMGGLKSVPSNSLFFGGSYTSISYKGFGQDRSISVDNEDLAILKANLEGKLRFLTPINFAGSYEAVEGEYKYTASVIGTGPTYKEVIPQQVIYGRYLNDIDLYDHRKVCLIGLQVYETLYPGGGDPTGKLIKVGGIYYTIIGVVKKLSNMISIGADVNSSIILPLSTEQITYNDYNRIAICAVTLHDRYPIKEWKDKVLAYPKEQHYVHPDDKMAFWSFDLSEVIGMFNNLFIGINILLWIVGCGSLIAGLIGISNIMLVTVKERTQEIGIRRALGARPRTILSQILAESLVLTMAAGVTGLMTGVWVLRVTEAILSANPSGGTGFQLKDPQISFSIAVSALVVIVVGGLLAGWMPAKRAMKIKAIEALREE